MIGGAGLIEIEMGPMVETFAGAGGEESAKKFGTYGLPIRACRPGTK